MGHPRTSRQAFTQAHPVEAEIGDYFNACMDEASREKSGAAPLQAELAKIAALKSLDDLAAFLAHTQLTSSGTFLFSFPRDRTSRTPAA